MNVTQKRYALQRVKEIEQDKIAAIPEVQTPKWTDADRLEAFTRGAWSLAPGVTGISRYTDVEDVVVFHDEPRDEDYEAAREATRRVRYAIAAEATRIRDQIMLGGSDIQVLLDWQAAPLPTVQ